MERGGKRLVICCDGTWNEPDQEVHDNPADETEPTNVLKIVRGLAPVDREQVPQVVYYDTGVGTQGPADKYVGGGLGGGLSENIQQAYRFFANNWREGDEIFLFGFSRGAYTVRSLAVDERRRPFQPDLWTGAPANGQTIEQVWFAGVHSNIGGGYRDCGLSNIALAWMAGRGARASCHGAAVWGNCKAPSSKVYAACNSSSAGAIFSALCTIRASAKSASVSRYACKALKMTSSSSKRTLGSCNKPPTKAITSVLAAR